MRTLNEPQRVSALKNLVKTLMTSVNVADNDND